MFVDRGALDKSRLRRFVVWGTIVFLRGVVGWVPEQFSGLFGFGTDRSVGAPM
jgi:hypothetical protein